VNCRFLNAVAGAVPDGTAGATAYRTLVENLRFAARLALPAGITILVEPVDSATLPARLSHRLDGRRRAARHVGCAQISLLYDVGHMHAMGEKVIAMIARHLSRIGHIQIAGCPGAASRSAARSTTTSCSISSTVSGIAAGSAASMCLLRIPRRPELDGAAQSADARTPSRWGIPLHAWRRPDAPAAGKAM